MTEEVILTAKVVKARSVAKDVPVVQVPSVEQIVMRHRLEKMLYHPCIVIVCQCVTFTKFTKDFVIRFIASAF